MYYRAILRQIIVQHGALRAHYALCVITHENDKTNITAGDRCWLRVPPNFPRCKDAGGSISWPSTLPF